MEVYEAEFLGARQGSERHGRHAVHGATEHTGRLGTRQGSERHGRHAAHGATEHTGRFGN